MYVRHVCRIRSKITWPHEVTRKKTFSYDRRIEKKYSYNNSMLSRLYKHMFR